MRSKLVVGTTYSGVLRAPLSGVAPGRVQLDSLMTARKVQLEGLAIPRGSSGADSIHYSSHLMQYHGDVEVSWRSQSWRAGRRCPLGLALSWSPESKSEPFGHEEGVEDVPTPAVGI